VETKLSVTKIGNMCKIYTTLILPTGEKNELLSAPLAPVAYPVEIQIIKSILATTVNLIL